MVVVVVRRLVAGERRDARTRRQSGVGEQDEPRTAKTAVRATPKFNERTGNVYESKGPARGW